MCNPGTQGSRGPSLMLKVPLSQLRLGSGRKLLCHLTHSGQSIHCKRHCGGQGQGVQILEVQIGFLLV